jgi:putative inorganic carbon (hco3(-)) transporter
MYSSVEKADEQRIGTSIPDTSAVHVVSKSRPFALFLVQVFWVLMVLELDNFLSAIVGGPFYRIPLVLAPLLAVLVFSNKNDKRVLYWPLMIFVLLQLGASVFAENRGLSVSGFKFMVYMVILLCASVSFLDSPSKIIGILKLYLISFAWMGVQGIPSGRVSWHPLLANEDSYGPLMVISMAYSYFFAIATVSRAWRWIARGVFLLSILGLMCSFARGAGLAGALVIGYIMMYSPHKLRMLAGMLLAGIVVAGVASTMISLDAYIEEIRSSAEGDSGRMVVWGLAWRVFLESPIYGVGAYNFGVIASMIADQSMVAGFVNSPENLYMLGVHNSTLQILAEEGVIGVTVWIVMIAGFFWRMRRIQSKDAIIKWNSLGGEGFDLRAIARGLEGAMIGFLATSIFYNQLYIHWFWSLITIGYVLAGIVSPAAQPLSTNRTSPA